ncbi:MAG: TaqI-like C-terminal specificity domain-containing protein [Candidatus Aminicenantes bacterium]|nr:TaqI-like C-terminal specificity domain-containing protein [Candidatus Aminicenantes bacterium]
MLQRVSSIKMFSFSTIYSEQEFNNAKEEIINKKDLLRDPECLMIIHSSFIRIIDNIRKEPFVELGSICTIYQGIITGDNSKYISSSKSGKKWEKIIRGRDIDRYCLKFGNNYVYYEPKLLWSNTNLIMFNVEEKLISRQTSDHLAATFDHEAYFSLDSTHVIHLRKPIFSLKYLLGLFNSRLMNYIYSNRVQESNRVFAQVKAINLKPLPIRTIDFSNAVERDTHNQLVSLVEIILSLNKKIQKVAGYEKVQIQHQIEKTDREIDELVYKLYGITDAERAIIEKETDRNKS